jgi:putative DNA methylase
MNVYDQQPRRLIEADLPIRDVSQEARREKSIRHGHISTLHIWWARRPLAACRAVALAALLPDPTDERCSEAFRDQARDALQTFRDGAGGPPIGRSLDELCGALLRFVARFASWDQSTQLPFLTCARALVAAAYPDGPPLVVDPFAGGGAIPLEFESGMLPSTTGWMGRWLSRSRGEDDATGRVRL